MSEKKKEAAPKPEAEAQNTDRVFYKVDTERINLIYTEVSGWAEKANEVNDICKGFGVSLGVEQFNEFAADPAKLGKLIVAKQLEQFNDKNNPYLEKYIKEEAHKKFLEAFPRQNWERTFQRIPSAYKGYLQTDKDGKFEVCFAKIEEDCTIYLEGYDLQVLEDIKAIQAAAKRLFCGQQWKFGRTPGEALNVLFKLEVFGSSQPAPEPFELKDTIPFQIFRDLKKAEAIFKA